MEALIQSSQSPPCSPALDAPEAGAETEAEGAPGAAAAVAEESSLLPEVLGLVIELAIALGEAAADGAVGAESPWVVGDGLAALGSALEEPGPLASGEAEGVELGGSSEPATSCTEVAEALGNEAAVEPASVAWLAVPAELGGGSTSAEAPAPDSVGGDDEAAASIPGPADGLDVVGGDVFEGICDAEPAGALDDDGGRDGTEGVGDEPALGLATSESSSYPHSSQSLLSSTLARNSEGFFRQPSLAVGQLTSSSFHCQNMRDSGHSKSFSAKHCPRSSGVMKLKR